MACDVFSLLVKNDQDAVGALAYALYKRHKSEFIDHYSATHGRPPNEQELATFHCQSCVDTQVRIYLASGERLARKFMDSAMQQRIRSVEKNAREAESARLVGQILVKLGERRTLKGWLADVGANLLVSLLAIFVVGALYLGYQNMAIIGTATEIRTGVKKP